MDRSSLVLLVVAVPWLTACGDIFGTKDAHQPGDKLGTYHVAAKRGATSVVISARIEQEISMLGSDEEKKDFLESLGLAETGLSRIVKAGYELLELVTYFTVGPKECRAWTITEGTLAPAAAGVIHSDFEQGFIRAETIGYDDYVAGQGEQGAKKAGKFRLEGKEYPVRDGDVLHFRFSN